LNEANVFVSKLFGLCFSLCRHSFIELLEKEQKGSRLAEGDNEKKKRKKDDQSATDKKKKKQKPVGGSLNKDLFVTSAGRLLRECNRS